MEYPVSRVVVQRICDERDELVPYLARVIDSMERHGGLFSAKLAEVVPVDVIEELDEWLKSHSGGAVSGGGSQGLEADLELLERIFPEYVDELVR